MRTSMYSLEDEMPFEPAGVAGKILYNGLVLNDKDYPDIYFVEEITGLDDPAVRDSREPNPDRDGETAADSMYSGRLITLRGYIEAGNYFSMKKMWSDFKDAFDDPVDRWMSFLWNDRFEGFDGNWWAKDYFFDAGDTVDLDLTQGSRIIADDTRARRIIYQNRQYTDGDASVYWVNGPSGPATSLVGAIFRRVAADTYAYAAFQSGALKIFSVVAGTPTQLATVAYTSAASTSYWLKVSFEGAVATASIYTSDPDLGGTPAISVAGSLPSQLGTGIKGRSGVAMTASSTSDPVIIIGARFEARNPGDTMILCRKSGKIESPDAVNDRGLYRKPFLLAMASPDPHYVSRKTKTVVTPITAAQLIFPSDGSGFTFPADGSGLRFGQPYPDTIVNLGRSPAYPKVRFYGPIVNPGIYCVQTDRVMAAEITLATISDWVEFDVDDQSIVDQNGDNRYESNAKSSQWMLLARKDNHLIFGADSFTPGTTKVSITYHHTSR